MKKLIIFGYIIFLVLGVFFIVGCDDEDDSPKMANITYMFTPSSGSAEHKIDEFGNDWYIWDFTLSMEEITGIGVQLLSEAVVLERDDRSYPWTDLFDCDDLEESYNLQDCFLPGNHSAVNTMVTGLGISGINIRNPKWVKLTFILTGIDDLGNTIVATAIYNGTGYQGLKSDPISNHGEVSKFNIIHFDDYFLFYK